jgi:alpha-L-rhamnosidase
MMRSREGIDAQVRGPHFPSGAYWIGSAHPFDLHEAYLDFRRTLQIDENFSRARMTLTADSRYKLWINGKFVSRGPARCYPHAQSVVELEVTPFLRPGPNVLTVQVYQPGYSHFAYVHRAASGLLAALACDGVNVLATDGLWRVRRNPSFSSLVPRVSIYGSGVEERDLNRDDEWTGTGYDDSGWSSARIVAPVGGSPWTGLEPCGLPQLVEREIPYKLLEMRTGTAHVDSDAHSELRRGWAEAREQTFSTDDAGWFAPRLAKGEAVYCLFDLGRDYTCQGWAEVEGAGGGESMSVSYAEKFRGGTLVISDPETYCRLRLTDRFTLRAGSQVVETFALRGGRYVLYQLFGAAGPEFKVRFHARISEYPLEITRPFRPSDPELSSIVSLCEETFRACLLDGFVDSTWRESSQWTGDALPQALVMSSLTDDIRPLRRVIEMAAEGAYPDGILPSVLPGEVHVYTVVDYNFIWGELLSAYWRMTRDLDFVIAMWSALVRMLDRFARDANEEGLIVAEPGRRLFLDWAPVSRNEPNAIYNLHYLLALRVAAELADSVDESAEAVNWRERADALREAVRSAFWHDGRWYDDKALTTSSQLAAAFALLSGATEVGEEKPLLDAIAARSLDDDDSAASGKMVLASPFMHHYIFEALRRGGKGHEVVEIVRRRWGRWVAAGYPTAWENWNVDFPDGSQCHAFSAHPRYHLAEIAREFGPL